jgi:hypothetical protein
VTRDCGEPPFEGVPVALVSGIQGETPAVPRDDFHLDLDSAANYVLQKFALGPNLPGFYFGEQSWNVLVLE